MNFVSSLSLNSVRNVSYMLAFIGMFVQLVAATAWWNIFRQPVSATSGGRLKQDPRRSNTAAIATVAAFGFSAVAALLAIVGWIY